MGGLDGSPKAVWNEGAQRITVRGIPLNKGEGTAGIMILYDDKLE